MLPNETTKLVTFDSINVTVQDIQAMGLEVECVHFKNCYIGEKGWGPIIKLLSQH
jgi:hypothetical protein